jgi:site-specific DNA-methyltransferase (adenine-specific)
MNSESVDLIYLDPPFNSKADYAAPIGSRAAGAAFKDTWSLSDIDAEWINQMEVKHPTLWRVLLVAMTPSDKSYLAYMAVRLLEMHRILKPTGSIYLHCDPTMSHYLKLVMDAIFDRKSFRNEVTWKRTTAHSDATRFGRTSDRLLFYGANISRNSVREPLDSAYVAAKYRREDERGRFQDVDLTGPGISQGEAGATWRGWSPTSIGRHWSVPRTGDYAAWIDKNLIPGYLAESSLVARLALLDDAGMIVLTSRGTPRLKRYLAASQGRVPADVWTDIPPVNSQAKERTGYPTQKPLALLERIIKASSNPGDMVLDPFCGCATACVAAEKLGRQWTGIDISPKAVELVHARLAEPPPLGIGSLFHNRLVSPRDDIPIRDDLGPLPAYNCTHNRQTLYGQQGGHCAGCAEHFMPRHLTVDHIIAKSKGGTDHLENLQLLCGHCNSVKGDRGMAYLRTKLQIAA